MDQLSQNHLTRIKSATTERHSIGDIPAWITQHTKMGISPFSFKDHEYQERILQCEAPVTICQKPSQVGMSEASVRLALALVNILSPYTLIYVLPTAGFASTFMRTRFDPVIEGSSLMKESLHTSTDNSEVKRFGASYLYVRGAASSNSPISIPADHIIADEYDFADSDIVSQYQSRLTHSKYRRVSKFSTPTIPGFGVSLEMETAKRWYNYVKCDHCNEWFYPDYFRDVVIPGFDGDLRGINKNTIPEKYNEARLKCPSCGATPSLQPAHRNWVCENPDTNFVAEGFFISPFDAPNIITPGYLVHSSTQYARYSDFINYGLGLTAVDADTTITREDMLSCLVDGQGEAYSRVLGLDMGMICTAVIGAVGHGGSVTIIHVEFIHLSEIKRRVPELMREFRIRMAVMDSQPYTDTAMMLCADIPNLFAAVYSESKSIDIYSLKDREEDEDEGVSELRQVNINRTRGFDLLLGMVKSGDLAKSHDENDEVWIAHALDMKRAKKFTRDNELVYSWVKSKQGMDHAWHATLYAVVASRIMGVSKPGLIIPVSAMLGSFRVKSAA